MWTNHAIWQKASQSSNPQKHPHYSMKSTLLILSLALAALNGPALGAAKPMSLFTQGMVLQRETIVPVWGSASPGEQVSVEFAGQKKSTTADANGNWMVKLDPMPASASPATMTVSAGGSSTNISNVLVGDVFLAGGQSNMGSPLFAAHNAAEVLPQATDDKLRFFNVPKKTAAEPQTDVAGQWKPTDPTSARDFSAVAYFFAREIRKSADVPVGVVSAPWGGTPIETWMSLDSIKEPPTLTNVLSQWDKALVEYAKVKADPKLVADYESKLEQWKKEVYPAFSEAKKAYDADKAAGKPVGEKPKPAWPEPDNPDPMGIPSPSKRPSTPSVSYNAMIAPLSPVALKGVLWYQGEANAGRGIEYRDLFPRMIVGWRKQWGVDFPFLFVQLPMNGKDPVPVAKDGEPYLREAQFMTLSEPKTAMAITIDIGDPNNVHPADKIDVGKRLSLLARRDIYGEKIDASGPLYQGFKVEGDKVRISFKETAKGLKPGQAPWCAKGVEPLPTDKLVGFYIAGSDKNWVEADAVIDGNDVVVSSRTVTTPVAVRYGWAHSPRCNLYNSEDLPASPFRTDDWQSGPGVGAGGSTNPAAPAIRVTE
jgi:sialate O-acetylesterase